jgi:hypothetical protein
MSADNELSVNKAPKLSGEEIDYCQWEMRFQVYVEVRKFLTSIDPEKTDPHLPDNPGDVPANGFANDQKKAMERKTVAMYTLTLALTSQSSMGFILKTRTKEYPGGLAWKVMALMKERYASKDTAGRLEMRRQLAAIKNLMDDAANPAVTFEEFHRLTNIFNDPKNGMEIFQDNFMAQVFSAAPPVYQSILSMESRICANTSSLTPLETVMCQFWRTTVAKGELKEKEKEVESAKILERPLNELLYV